MKIKINKLHKIPGFKNYYIVKNKNKVYSKNRKKFMKIRSDKSGYLYVKLRKNGKSKMMYIHRLQWITFIDKHIPKGMEIDHKNSDKENNSLKNLQLLTKSQNISKAHKDGLHKYAEESKNSIFTNKEIHKICKMMCEGKKPKLIIKELGIKDKKEKSRYSHVIEAILNKDAWKSISKNYDFRKYNENKRQVLDKKIVEEICKLLENNNSLKEINEKLNVSIHVIYKIKVRKNWKNISKNYKW